MCDSRTHGAIDLGSDHRPIYVILQFIGKRIREKPRTARLSWNNAEVSKYRLALADSLHAHTACDSNVSLRADALESVMMNATDAAKRKHKKQRSTDSLHNKEVTRLISERRQNQSNSNITTEERGRRRRDICKLIQKHTRLALKHRKTIMIGHILANLQGVKTIPAIHSNNIRRTIAKMVQDDGNIVTDTAGISSVFADYYERLHSRPAMDRCHDTSRCRVGLRAFIPDFTISELRMALQTMHRRRTSDDNGIIVEMILDGNDDLRRAILDLFNHILSSDVLPESWLLSRIVVLFSKKGIRQKLPTTDHSRLCQYFTKSLVVYSASVFPHI